MKLNKPTKIVLGILTYLPILAAISIIGFVIFNFLSMFFNQEPAMPLMYLSYLSYIIPYFFPIIFLSMGLYIFYLVHIIRNQYFDNEKRILWIVVLFVLGGITMPIYWYIHIWKNNSSEANKADGLTGNYYEPGTQP